MTCIRDDTRRDFLQTASAATLEALAAGAPRLAEGAIHARPKLNATADCVIVLWMGGGMAHTETFDPKPLREYKAGMKAEGIASTFKSINTSVDNIKLCEGLENIGRVMNRGTLIRSHVAADLGKILHSRHQYHWHTGYEPPQTVAAPHLGAWIAHTLGRDPAVPAFIDIGQGYDGNGEADELRAFQTGGFLGSEYGPFRVPDPSRGIEAVRPPAGMSAQRFENRERAFKRLIAASPVGQLGSDYQQESLLRSLDNAHRLLTSKAASAFDLSLEPKHTYDAYNTGKFGLGCLMARRLAEVGARFIEVTTEYIPFLGWDTHDNGHTRAADMKKSIDMPIAQLVSDLDRRGLLGRTLIVLASEFSRSVLIEGRVDNLAPDSVPQPDIISEPKYFGMHRHFTGAGSALLFGGGFKQGYLYGKTADETPCTTIEKPVTVTDLHATIYRALGIPADHMLVTEKRPFYVTKDGLGKPVLDLLA